MEITIACQGAFSLPYSELHVLQGDLKTLSKEDYQKLRKEIIETGFAFAEHVWKNPKDEKWYLVDGTQRRLTVANMVEKEGFSCPPLPCVSVQAKDEKEAKRRVLQGTAQYGKMSEEGLHEFMVGADLEFADLNNSFRLPDIDLSHFEENFFLDKNFAPGTEEDQGKLDEKKPVECPNCGHQFTT